VESEGNRHLGECSFDVFVSYARAEIEFARGLVKPDTSTLSVSAKRGCSTPRDGLALGSKLLGLHRPFGMKFGNGALGEAHVLKHLARVLAQQRSGPALEDLGAAEPDIVPGHALLSQEGVLVCRDHVVRSGVWVAQKKLAVP
jgi:hypothetical protein